MNQKTRNRYKKIKKDQASLIEKIKKHEEELELLRLEEEEIAGQEIIAICYEQKISLVDAVKIFSGEGSRRENKILVENQKENKVYGKQ